MVPLNSTRHEILKDNHQQHRYRRGKYSYKSKSHRWNHQPSLPWSLYFHRIETSKGNIFIYNAFYPHHNTLFSNIVSTKTTNNILLENDTYRPVYPCHMKYSYPMNLVDSFLFDSSPRRVIDM